MGHEVFVSVVLFLICVCNGEVFEDGANEDYQLSGLISYESIPLNSPKDLCVFRVDDVKFSAGLHYKTDEELQFVLFKQKNGSYIEVFTRSTPLAVNMDCISMGSKGYIALTFQFEETVSNITNGSPVFEVTTDEIAPIQFFVTKHQNAVYLRKHGSKLFLIQSHRHENLEEPFQCPIYELSEYHFNYKHDIPCANAQYIEPFVVDSTVYAIVSNRDDNNEDMQTTSILYKYRYDPQHFVQHQTFKTDKAVPMKYFFVERAGQQPVEHFLIMGGRHNRNGEASLQDIGDPIVIHKYKNGIFEPLQQLYFHNVSQFLPVNNLFGKFVLLVACQNQDVQFIRYNGQRFEMSRVQLTSGALSKGVASMRTFADSNATYIVVANERMQENETNVYLPIYKLRPSHKNLRIDLIERFKHLYAKLTNETRKMENIEAVAKNFAQGIGLFQHADIQQVDTKLMINKKYNLTKEKWQQLETATKSLSDLQKRVDQLNQRTANNKSDDGSTYEALHLGTLIVTDRLNVATINNKSLHHLSLDTIIADEIVIKGKTDIKNTTQLGDGPIDLQEIEAKQIIVTGTVNGLNLSEFQNRILMKNGEQVITAPYRFQQIEASDVQVNGSINGERSSKVVMINGGSFVVDQDIIFTQQPVVNQLVINDRLNHINVVQGRLEVLLNDSPDLQVVEGKKTFENVRLMEPFTLKSKIYSPRLDAINPVAVISENISLEGDYEILGNVLVTNRISANNFFGDTTQRNLLEVMHNGLSINTSVIYQSMDFKGPVEAENVKAAFLNRVDVGDFVVNDKDAQQIITGTKTFRNDVHLSRGHCDVKNVNGVNLKSLSETRLQKYGDQTITGKLQFKKIHVKKLNTTSSVFFNRTDLNDILTTSTPQNLTQVTIENLKVNKIQSKELNTSDRVFDQHLDFIINDTLLAGESATIHGFKTFVGHVTTKDLSVNGKINGRDIKELADSYTNLNEDIVIDEPVEFVMDMTLDSLTFEGKINGIPAEQFGNNWLLMEGDQNFTAPQKFDAIQVKDMYISGKFNNYSFNEIIDNVYWLDREETIPYMSFENVVAEKDITVGGHINEMKFAQSVLLKESEETQTIEAAVTCEGDIIATGQIKDLSILNNINFVHLQAVLSGQSNGAKLTIDSAVFENQPEFEFLNDNNLTEIIENVWFINQDVEIDGAMWFADVDLQSFPQLNGLVNGVDLKYLDEYYLSLSKTQRVTTPIILKDPSTFEDSLIGEKMTLKGVLVDIESDRALNITDFSVNCLRNDIAQDITGEWSFSTAIVEGDLNDVVINGLRLYDDVLRYDVHFIQNITAPKVFTKVTISDLQHSYQGSINNINIIEWMRNAVLTDGNYTIQGRTTIDDLVVYEDVNVFGTVNGVKFDETHLLMVDTEQTVYGNVTIRTKFEKKKQIIPLSIEHVNVTAINDVRIDDFFQSIIPKASVVKMEGNFVFETLPIVKNFHSKQDLLEMVGLTTNTTPYVQQLIADYTLLEDSLKVKAAFLSHYVYRQSASGDIQKVIYLKKAAIYDKADDLIAVLRGENELYITFHKWDNDANSFDLNTNLFQWTAENATIIDCDKITVQNFDVLLVETFNQSSYSKYFISITNEGLQVNLVLNSRLSEQVTPIGFKGQQCFALYTSYYYNISIECIKLRATDGVVDLVMEVAIDIKDTILEVVALKESQFVVSTPQGIRVYNLNSQIPPVFVERVELNPDFFIYIQNPISVVAETYDGNSYLAATSGGRNIEIFSSSNASIYHHVQTIEVLNVVDIKFSRIDASNDFLLYVLTTDQTEPLSGYTYCGVLRFKKSFRPINLKPARRFDVISLEKHDRHLVAYQTNQKVQFIEAIVSRA